MINTLLFWISGITHQLIPEYRTTLQPVIAIILNRPMNKVLNSVGVELIDSAFKTP
ncbi:MAG: hypothetical protein WBB19_04430 [Desulforhopalus sp.]